MPSPVCTVRSGTSTAQTTPPVAKVTAGQTVTIALVDLTGVNVWDIACISADETTDAQTITSALVIDTAAKTATFTAPSAGKAMLFRSVVNRGLDAFTRPDPSLVTTFKVAVPTVDEGIVLALNETFEHDPAYGWMPIFNAMIREGLGGMGSGLPPLTNVDGAVLVDNGLSTAEWRVLSLSDIQAPTNVAGKAIFENGAGGYELRKLKATDVDATGETASKALVANGSGGAAFRQLQASDISGLAGPATLSPITIAGAVIVEDPAGTFVVRKLRQSDLAPDFAIASFNKTSPDSSTLLYARGSTITGLAFSATYSNGTPESASIAVTSSNSTDPSDTDLGALTFNAPFASASYAGSLKRNGADAGADPVVTFTLTATDNDTASTKTSARSITFTSHVYWGLSASASINGLNVFNGSLQSGFSDSLQQARTQTRSVSPSNQYVFLLWPNASPYTTGTAVFTDTLTGFSFDVAAQSTVQIARNGVTRTYAVWRSAELLAGTFSVKVE